MISSNILQRVFRLRAGEKHGTGFAIPWKGHTYMVTAKHIFDGSPLDRFDLFHLGAWSTAAIPVVAGSHGYDVAVMRMPETFQPGNTIIVGEKGVFLSEDVYMLGYPLGFYHEASMNPPNVNNYFPLPLVAKGCLAAIPGIGGPVEGGLIVSGQIDVGFSGGPIVAVRDHLVAGIRWLASWVG